MDYLIFFILNVFAWFAIASLTKLLWVATQPGEIFGKWQDVLAKWDEKGSIWFKLLGGCSTCTGHFMTIISYIPFITFAYFTDLFPFNGWHVLTWYLIYVPIGAIITIHLLSNTIK